MNNSMGQDSRVFLRNCGYTENLSGDESKSSNFRGKIIKLPRDLDPNEMISDRMNEKYSVCPFCGESKKHTLLMGNEGTERDRWEIWYGKQKHWWHIWEESHRWKIDHWHCWKCGAEWESEAYPTDISILEVGK
jgi:ribosomal protein L37AE/L43A